MGWVKSSLSLIARTFAYPFAAAVGLAAVLATYWWKKDWDPGYQPMLLALGATFIFTTVILEFYRGMRSRMRVKRETPGEALVNLPVSSTVEPV